MHLGAYALGASIKGEDIKKYLLFVSKSMAALAGLVAFAVFSGSDA